MDVVLRVLREIVVDDVAHTVDVEAAARDVGGNQNRQRSVAEIIEDPKPCGLDHVAGEAAGRVAVAAKIVDQPLRAVTCIDKDHGARAAFPCEHAEEQSQLFPCCDVIEHLVNGVGCQMFRTDNNLDWVVHLPPAEGHHAL